MRNFSALALAPEVHIPVLSPVFQKETVNVIKPAILPQQQQYDRYAGLSSAQMREIIRQQQM